MTKVAVVLSGCGHQDGAEIREAVLALLYLDQKRASVSIFAPDIHQTDVINHVTGKPMPEVRNVLVEAARIARGHIQPLTEANAAEFDALVIPGGLGAAKNLCNFASKGEETTIIPELKRLILDFYAQQKPIAAMCIAPVVLAKALSGKTKPMVTVGDDEKIAATLKRWGSEHWNCPTTGCVIDRGNLLVTCSAYMRDDRLSVIAEGIEKTIDEVINLTSLVRRMAA